MFLQQPTRIVFLVAIALTCPITGQGAKLEVHNVPGITLQGNPLGDPPVRRVAVFVPDDSEKSKPIPLVIYLPGWGGSSDGAIAGGTNGMFAGAVDQLATRGTSVRIAVVDGRSRYGGSQFLNSAATGNYADYVSREILPFLTSHYAIPKKKDPQGVIIAGHSSGAYGALMLAMDRKELLGSIVALSPDSDFEVTHKPLVEAPVVRAVTKDQLEAAMARSKTVRLPQDGHVQLIMGLCANYAPIPEKPGRFEWLYDEQGKWRQEAWQRWLDLDPLNVIRRHSNAFTSEQRIYLDGAERDEFGANIGARKMYEVLKERKSPVTFYEAPGGHNDRLTERLIRGLSWVLEK